MAEMPRIGVTREVLARMLRAYDEHDLAGRAASLTDQELQRIGTLGAFYAWSEEAFELGFGMGGSRALALASVDVLESNGRNLRRQHSESEVAMGFAETPDSAGLERELELRRRAADQGLHGL